MKYTQGLCAVGFVLLAMPQIARGESVRFVFTVRSPEALRHIHNPKLELTLYAADKPAKIIYSPLRHQLQATSGLISAYIDKDLFNTDAGVRATLRILNGTHPIASSGLIILNPEFKKLTAEYGSLRYLFRLRTEESHCTKDKVHGDFCLEINFLSSPTPEELEDPHNIVIQ